MLRRLTVALGLTLAMVSPAWAQFTLQRFTNNATTTLAADISDSDTSITLATGDGAKFPSPTGGQFVLLTLSQSGTTEIVKCTARSSDTFSSCTRAQDNTSAAAFTTGATIYLDWTAAAIAAAQSSLSATFLVQTATSDLPNEQAMGALGTGLVKNTTTTGVQSIYAGTSCTNQFPRSLDASGAASCASVSLTADVTGTLPGGNGGTNNAFMQFTGPATSTKTYTLPNASATLLTDNAAVTVAQGGTGAATLTGVLKGNGTSAFTAATAGTDYVSPSSSETLTNKTLDAEGTGNSLTIPVLVNYVPALCQNGAGYLGTSTTATTPSAVCVSGTNVTFGVAQFADTNGAFGLQGHFPLPADWTGAIDLLGKYRGSGTSGNVVWQLSTACVADGETSDPSFNTANTVTDGQKGTTLQQNDFTISSLTTTGCAAGEEFYWKLVRDRSHASDTATGTVDLIAFTFRLRRAL